MRNWLTIVESALRENAGSPTIEAALPLLLQSLPGNGLDTVRTFIRIDAGLDPYGGKDPSDFQNLLRDWCEDKLHEVAFNLGRRVKDGKIQAWREITAGENWTPVGRHPGIYWSWDKHAAEAHWGGHDHEGHGPVTWVMEALIPTTSIDWPTTLSQNANPDYEEEREIRILSSAPVEMIRYWRKD
jgi:hypothetical protein